MLFHHDDRQGFYFTFGGMKLPKSSKLPIIIYPYTNGRVYTKPREKSDRVYLVPEDIHDRQLYKLNKNKNYQGYK
jgi:hypothetical protein